MSKPSKRKQRKPLRALTTLAVAAAGGYLAYSALRPDPSEPLSNAVAAERRRYLSPKAGALSYYVSNEESVGTPLVLIHSINAAASSYELKPLFDAYHDQRPVYALDLPGFGFSDRSERKYIPQLYTDAISDFLTDIVAAPSDIVTMSLSAEFVTRVAVSHSTAVRSLTLISPTGFRATPVEVPDTVYEVVSLPIVGNALYDPLISRRSIRYFLGKSFIDDVPPSMVDYAWCTAHQPGAKNAPLYFVGGRLFTANIRREVYKQVSTPTLVIYDRDPNVPFDALHGFIAAYDNWHAKRIAPSLGMPHWEKRHETMAAMEAFWQKIEDEEAVARQ